MYCPTCGAQASDDARFCGTCGTPFPVGTAPAPPVPPARAAATPPSASHNPRGWTWVVVAGAIILCTGVAVGWVVRRPAPKAPSVVVAPGLAATTTPALETPPVVPSTDAQVEVAAKVIADYYAAINAADLVAARTLVVPDLVSQMDPGTFEGWQATTFEFTRGWVDGATAYVIGRESPKAYGPGTPGGVRFTLSNGSGAWLIKTWQPVDSTQVEGSATTGTSSGILGPLSAATARTLVTRLLQARRKGAANTIKTLATAKFLSDNGDAWLDGYDNAQYFTRFVIKSVAVAAGTATVKVSESWPDGTITATYGLVEQGGAVLADSWRSQ